MLSGKRGFKGESIQMKKQILELSGERSTFKLQLIDSFAFREAKTNKRINSLLHPQDSACCSHSHASCEHHGTQPAAAAAPAAAPAAQDPSGPHPRCPNSPFLASGTARSTPSAQEKAPVCPVGTWFAKPTAVLVSAEHSRVLAGKAGDNSFLPVGQEGVHFYQQNMELCL